MTTHLLTTTVLLPVLASQRWEHHGGGWFPWLPLLPLLWIGLVVAAIVFVGRRRRALSRGLSGEEVLAGRYARGEIDEDEYRTRRAVLRSKDKPRLHRA